MFDVKIQETKSCNLELPVSYRLVSEISFSLLTGFIKELVEHDVRLLSEWKSCVVDELNVQLDHVHLVVSIPPKVSVSSLMGTLKGKLAIKLFKSYPQLKQKPYWGNHFWSRGYFVNTVGMDEDIIRHYVRYQEEQDKQEEGFSLFD